MLHFICIGSILLILKAISRYLVYKNNQCTCTNYSDFKCNCIESKYKAFLILKFNQIINIIFFIYIVISFIYALRDIADEVSLYEDLKWLAEYSDVLNTVLGAFLASSLGILTQAYKNRKNKKSEEVKYAILLYEEIANLITLIEEIQLKHKLYKNKEEILSEPCIYYYEEWRNYYVKLNNRLTSEHYRKILSLYDIISIYNNAVNENDYEIFLYSIEAFNKWIGKSYSPLKDEIEYYELMEDLESVAHNKKKPKRIFSKIKDEYDIKRFKLKYMKEIESLLFELIKQNNTHTSYLIDKEILDILKSKSDFNKISRKNIERIIFEIVINSKIIDKQWGKYYIVKDE